MVDLQTVALQLVEIMTSIVPALEPLQAHVYTALWWRSHAQGRAVCEISQADLASATGLSHKTIARILDDLRTRLLVRVEEEGVRGRPTRYHVSLAREAGLPAGEIPAAWADALRGPRVERMIDRLDASDLSLLTGIYESLPARQRDQLRRDACATLRANGWKNPEGAGEELEQQMLEQLLPQQFGPDRLEKYLAGDTYAA